MFSPCNLFSVVSEHTCADVEDVAKFLTSFSFTYHRYHFLDLRGSGFAHPYGLIGKRNDASVRLRFSNEEGICDYSNVPQEYNRCVKAHSSDELEEWNQRVSYRHAKLRISRQNSAADSTYQNITEFSLEVPGSEVTCDGSLEVHLTEKTSSCTWNFHIEV